MVSKELQEKRKKLKAQLLASGMSEKEAEDLLRDAENIVDMMIPPF